MLITHNGELQVIYAAIVDYGFVYDTTTDKTFRSAREAMLNVDRTGERFLKPFRNLASKFLDNIFDFDVDLTIDERLACEIESLKKTALAELDTIEVDTIRTNGGITNTISILAGVDEYFSWPETSVLFIIAKCAGSILNIVHDVKSIAKMLAFVRVKYRHDYDTLTVPVMVMEDHRLESGCYRYNPSYSIYYVTADQGFFGRSIHGYNGIEINPKDSLDGIVS